MATSRPEKGWKADHRGICTRKSLSPLYDEWEIKGCRLCNKVELLQVIRLVEKGKIKPVVSKTLPFEKANEALEALKMEDTTGRIVLTI
jgi:D-arabinose 1-dehydrogenase-like Zn-dependent alcohol dehydrogenase